MAGSSPSFGSELAENQEGSADGPRDLRAVLCLNRDRHTAGEILQCLLAYVPAAGLLRVGDQLLRDHLPFRGGPVLPRAALGYDIR